MKLKKLPIGLSDFKRLIEDNYYYVDKSSFIEQKQYKADLRELGVTDILKLGIAIDGKVVKIGSRL